MSELEEYHQNLMADIRREADASGIMMVEAFFERMTERLTPQEGALIMGLVETWRRALETEELEARVAALEGGGNDT